MIIYNIIIIVPLSAADRLTRRPAATTRRAIVIILYIILCYYSVYCCPFRVCNNGTTTADAVAPHSSDTILINRLFSESILSTCNNMIYRRLNTHRNACTRTPPLSKNVLGNCGRYHIFFRIYVDPARYHGRI